MKYLVLGSEGQIGGHLCQYIREKGHDVIEYDIKRDENEDLRLLAPKSKEKEELLERCIVGCDFVFFLAWDVGGSKYLSSTESSFDFIHNNTLMMASAFGLLKKWNKPVIFTSSQMAGMPHSAYGSTKVMGERYTESLNGIVVRLWNVYGEEPVDEKSHVITDFVNMALTDGVIRMRTDGSELRQFLYAEDCCEALFALSEVYNKVSRQEALHISSYVWTSIEDVAEMVSSLCKCTYVKGDLKDSVQMSLREEPNKNILKYWKPTTTIYEGIGRIIKKVKSSHI